MGRLQGKVAIVTGAATGLGRADARGTGARRRSRRADATSTKRRARQLAAGAERDAARDARALRHQDVRDEARWQAVIAETVAQFGGLHVLVNNAGVVRDGDTGDTARSSSSASRTRSCPKASFSAAQHASRRSGASGGGSIINMSSMASHLGYPVYFAYSAAKGAVRAMTKSIAVHCQMNKYEHPLQFDPPGSDRDTPWCAKRRSSSGMEMSDYEQSADGARASPRTSANLVVFLASDESRYINGAEILVDNALTVQ